MGSKLDHTSKCKHRSYQLENHMGGRPWALGWIKISQAGHSTIHKRKPWSPMMLNPSNHTHTQPPLCEGDRSLDLLVTNQTQQSWSNVISIMKLPKNVTVMSILPADFCLLSTHTLCQKSQHGQNCTHLSSQPWWATEALSQQLWRNWIRPTTWVSLESDPSPVELSSDDHDPGQQWGCSLIRDRHT